MRWVGHVTRLRERRGACRVLVGTLKERDYLEDPGEDGRIILKWICGILWVFPQIFRKWDWERGLD